MSQLFTYLTENSICKKQSVFMNFGNDLQTDKKCFLLIKKIIRNYRPLKTELFHSILNQLSQIALWITTKFLQLIWLIISLHSLKGIKGLVVGYNEPEINLSSLGLKVYLVYKPIFLTDFQSHFQGFSALREASKWRDK
jgi:hypothetical protein